MSDNTSIDKEKIQDVILFAVQEISDTAYLRFVDGELTQEGLEKIYNMLRQWTSEGDELLRVLN